jgi:polyvinyl alcohol dehydrogenase (cytochrome)
MTPDPLTVLQRLERRSMGAVIVLLFLLLLLPLAVNANAQAPTSGRALFDRACLNCHGNSAVPRAPDPSVLRRMTPERVYEALTTGSMRAQAQDLGDGGRRAVAEYLGDRKLGAGESGAAAAMPNRCAADTRMVDVGSMPTWNGWGVDAANTRFQPPHAARLTAADVPRLRLKWAFGVPAATAVYGQPTVAGRRVFFGADTGFVYALDQATGCVHWSFQAQAGVRSAPIVGSAGGRIVLWFGDMKGAVYAVDAQTGDGLWRVVVDDHPLARITAAPAFQAGRLYVSVASGEEGASTSARYPCCTFRGSVVALDARTGHRIWKTYTVPDAARPTRINAAGVQQWGPSGGGVWNTPTIDVTRNALYVGTGNAYSRPAAATTDAVVALALDDGRVLWSAQAHADDAWIPACDPKAPAGNCPQPLGPDYDFGSSPILVRLDDGRRLLLTAQKSGLLWAHDPDRGGAVVWKSPLPETAPTAEGEMVWGAAVDARHAYVGLTSGGVSAIDLRTGHPSWTLLIPPIPGRRTGHSGAVSAIAGAVFSGGWDGVVRALDSETGRELWTFDTQRDLETVNKVGARGGSIGAAGPTIAGGMVFVGSGYIGVRNGTPGNSLLAFGVE